MVAVLVVCALAAAGLGTVAPGTALATGGVGTVSMSAAPTTTTTQNPTSTVTVTASAYVAPPYVLEVYTSAGEFIGNTNFTSSWTFSWSPGLNATKTLIAYVATGANDPGPPT